MIVLTLNQDPASAPVVVYIRTDKPLKAFGMLTGFYLKYAWTLMKVFPPALMVAGRTFFRALRKK